MWCEYPCRNRSGDRLWSGFNRARGQPVTAEMRGRKVRRYFGKTGGTADKSLFVPGRFMICRGLFVFCSNGKMKFRYTDSEQMNRQTEELSGRMAADALPRSGQIGLIRRYIFQKGKRTL